MSKGEILSLDELTISSTRRGTEKSRFDCIVRRGVDRGASIAKLSIRGENGIFVENAIFSEADLFFFSFPFHAVTFPQIARRILGSNETKEN